MPVYNGERYIEEALESVFTQSYRNIEIVVVNDGSSDTSEDVLRRYKDKIQYIAQTNGGIAHAYNTGLSHCSGDYICFLEQDDVWLPGKVAAQVEYLRGSPTVEMIFTRYYVWNDECDSGDHLLSYCWPSSVSFQQLFSTSLEGEGIITFSSAMLRRDVVPAITPFDEQLCISVDYDTWLKLAYRSELGFIETPLVKYRVHDANTSRAPMPALTDDLRILENWRRVPEAVALLGKEVVRERIWKVCDALRFYSAQAKDTKAERHYLGKMMMLKGPAPGLIWQWSLTFFSKGWKSRLAWYARRLGGMLGDK